MPDRTHYIGIGSNLGNRLSQLTCAIKIIDKIKDLAIEQISPLYETEPIDCEGDWFLNAVIEVESERLPKALLMELREIEKQIGRCSDKTKTIRQEARMIDLDLLFSDDLISVEEDFNLPHPRLHHRRFVLAPMCDLNPHWMHPVCKKTVKDLYDGLEDQDIVIKRMDQLSL